MEKKYLGNWEPIQGGPIHPCTVKFIIQLISTLADQENESGRVKRKKEKTEEGSERGKIEKYVPEQRE